MRIVVHSAWPSAPKLLVMPCGPSQAEEVFSAQIFKNLTSRRFRKPMHSYHLRPPRFRVLRPCLSVVRYLFRDNTAALR